MKNLNVSNLADLEAWHPLYIWELASVPNEWVLLGRVGSISEDKRRKEPESKSKMVIVIVIETVINPLHFYTALQGTWTYITSFNLHGNLKGRNTHRRKCGNSRSENVTPCLRPHNFPLVVSCRDLNSGPSSLKPVFFPSQMNLGAPGGNWSIEVDGLVKFELQWPNPDFFLSASILAFLFPGPFFPLHCSRVLTKEVLSLRRTWPSSVYSG